ncbi:hypothetical protein AURDEDRAFT_114146, partial [Auricularia subglabra TFB-10046 SS5]
MHRTHDLPAKFKKPLVPVCVKEAYDCLRSVCPDVNVVLGDYDDAGFPYSIMLARSPIRIGVIHGHQAVPNGDLDALAGVARQMDVDVLVSGHAHVVQAAAHDGRFVKPGGASGAWSGAFSRCAHTWRSPGTAADVAGAGRDAIPSFALVDIQGLVVVTYIYQLVDEDPPVRIEQVEWRQPDSVLLPLPAAAALALH